MSDEKYIEQWLAFHGQRIGVAPEKLYQAFKSELTQTKNIDDPLEIPDKMEILYKYTYGSQSRFFRELRDHKKLFGARCRSCSFVYCPPRKFCSKCYAETAWTELSGEGTIEGCTVVYLGTSAHIGKVPFVCAYIKLDGADTFLWHFVKTEDVTGIKPGQRVRAVFAETRFGRLTDLWFEPLGKG